MLDRNNDGRVDLEDLTLFIEQLDKFSEQFINHEPTAKAIESMKGFILPMIELLDSISDEGMDTITEIRDDWKKFIDMLDDGENPLTIAMQLKKTIDETRENVQEIADIINDASDQVVAAKSFIEHFRVEAPKALAEFREDTARNKAEKDDEFAEMTKLWEQGEKLGAVKIALKDGTVYAIQQTAEFFDLLGDLVKAGSASMEKAADKVDDVEVTTELVETTVDTTTLDA